MQLGLLNLTLRIRQNCEQLTYNSNYSTEWNIYQFWRQQTVSFNSSVISYLTIKVCSIHCVPPSLFLEGRESSNHKIQNNMLHLFLIVSINMFEKAWLGG